MQTSKRRGISLMISALVLAQAVSTTHLLAQVQWRSAPAVPALQRAIRPVAEEVQSIVADAASRRLVLQFAQPVDDAIRQQLIEAGVRLLSPVGNNAYFASAQAGPRLAKLADIIALQSAQPIERSMKQHPAIIAGEWPDYAVASPADADGARKPEDIVAIYAVFHPDVTMNDAVAFAGQQGAVVKAELFTINALVLELPLAQVDALADLDAVQWVEPPLPLLSPVNDSNRALTQANTVQGVPYSLTGAGINVLVYDAGTARASHQDFGGRLTVRDASGMIDHATHVSGTVGGSGSASGGIRRGMAPGVTIQSYGFQYDGSGTFLYTNPGDLQSDYNQAINTFGVDIANNSIGTNTETNGFPCSIQGDYGVTDQLIDSIARGSLGAPFRIIWANGNERQGNRCDVEGFGDYYSTAPPATAKNHIAVGAVNSNNDSMTSFSSWGPTDDGRLKPDISGPGCQSDSDGGVTSCTAASDTAYGSFCGTSMAAPTVTGLCSLLLQDYRAQFPATPDPRNSTLKILLAHNAVDLGNIGPDYQFGYGSVRIQNTIDFMRTGNFFENSVGQGGVVNTSVTVAPFELQLKITLAWDDAPGTPNVNPALVNNLDLIVTSPSAVRAYPWTLNAVSPSSAALRTQANNVDNIEQVLVDLPEAGVWQIQVVGTNVPQGPQPFSICASPNIAVPAAINIGLPNGTPSLIAPNTPTVIDVQITTTNDTLVGGSEMFFYRFDGGSFISAPLTPTGGSNYTATLPGTTCSGAPEFYFRAQGTSSGTVTNPPTAPASVYTATIGEITVVVADDMETDQGWTVGDTGDNATTGIWTRVNPNGTAAQPEDDHTATPGVTCWVTGQGAVGGGLGDNDVDGGKTTLVTPTIDLSSGDATISYWRWYSNNTGAEPNADTFRVDISNANGGAGTWVNVETVGPAGVEAGGGWFFHEFTVSSIVAPTAQIKLRFIAEDAALGSLIEAAVDDFRVERFDCAGCPTITVDPTSCPDAVAGQPYTQLLSGSGGTGPYSFTVLHGSLPPGLSLVGDTLSGSAIGPIGSYAFTILATDANNCTGERSYSIAVTCPTIALAPTTLSATFVNRDYTKTITASGGIAPYSYGLSGGSLPPGLTLSPGGVISGTTTQAGTFNFIVTATESNGCAGNRAYSIVVRVKAVEPF
ncbi:MAG TPA: S8 family serine peptidase [Phycisphaerae bacterium]|nr:S8 family serine peptidase [Phycisphaerae bacterium]